MTGFRQDSMAAGSPHSSRGDEETDGSFLTTPNTTMTTFSPASIRQPQQPAIASSYGGTFVGSSNPDPFITNTRLGSSLSAQASSFAPSSYKGKGKEKAVEVIVQTPSKSSKSRGIHIIHVNPGLQENPIVNWGVFTTDSGSSRYIVVKPVDGMVVDDIEVLVDASIQALIAEGNYIIKGTFRKEIIGQFMFLRYADIRDAVKVYHTLNKHNPTLGLKFIPPSAFKAATSPTGKGYSAHEGQVYLTATYPAGVPMEKAWFENVLRNLLDPDNALCAIQKILATAEGEFSMVAEFFDVEVAAERIRAVDGITVSFVAEGLDRTQLITISVKMHEPDLAAPTVDQIPRGFSPSNGTPARISGTSEALDNAFSRLGIGSRQLGDCTSTTGPFGRPYSANGAHRSNFGAGMMNNPGYSPSSSMGMGNFHPMYSPSMNGFSGLGFAYSQGYNQAMIQPNYNYAGPSSSSFGPGYSPGQSYSPGYNSASSNAGTPSRNMPVSRVNAKPAQRHKQSRKLTPAEEDRKQKEAEKNRVRIANIQNGTDVRTTIMLRNIPNDIQFDELKYIIDLTCAGVYDFLYLRIHFSNGQNVGYGFMNFLDAMDIIPFMLYAVNRKWFDKTTGKFKIFEISYATSQGIDSLVGKLRNSSVMLEQDHQRPKLFYTVNDGLHLAGKEKPFPAADNSSKLKRSCENAGTQGLFAPAHGQHMRDEQRRRTSQYDRGTSLAQQDEFGYDEQYPPLGAGIGSSHGYQHNY